MEFEPKAKRYKEQPEYLLQKAICQYLSLQYPDVLFMTDTVASVKLTKMQAGRNSRVQKKGFKAPDLLIFEPRQGYCGLFIELKVETPYKLNGEIKASKNDHLLLQEECLEKLYKKGYYALFSWGFDMTKDIIDNYLKS
jgi:hypothetical protein